MVRRTCVWAGLILTIIAEAAEAGPLFFPLRKQDGPAVAVVPLELVAPTHREAVKQIVERPTLQAKSQLESFAGSAEVYRFCLDHPDRAVLAWRRLGAQCVSIQARGNQQFGFNDEKGEVRWETVIREPALRVWYAEGKVKPTPVTPPVPLKAVVVVRHAEGLTPDGLPTLRQQTEIFVHTDSTTAAAVTKMLGPTANKLAEQGLGQFQFFFSGLCQYLSRHPEQTQALFREEQTTRR